VIEVNSITFFLVLEIAFILLILTVILSVLMFKKRSNQFKAIHELIDKVNNNKAERLNTHYTFMIENFGYNDEDATDTAKVFVRQEIAFNKQLLQVLASNNPKMMPYIDKYIYNLSDVYQKLPPLPSPEPSAEVAPVAEKKPVDNSKMLGKIEEYKSKIAEIESEKTKLSDELQVTMDTMGKMLSEYTELQGEKPLDSSLIKKMLDFIHGHSEATSSASTASLLDEKNNDVSTESEVDDELSGDDDLMSELMDDSDIDDLLSGLDDEEDDEELSLTGDDDDPEPVMEENDDILDQLDESSIDDLLENNMENGVDEMLSNSGAIDDIISESLLEMDDDDLSDLIDDDLASGDDDDSLFKDDEDVELDASTIADLVDLTESDFEDDDRFRALLLFGQSNELFSNHKMNTDFH
jgi:hypothetical protein